MKGHITMHELKLTEYILHKGDTGSGEGVALVWLHGPCPIPKEAAIHVHHPRASSGDLTIHFDQERITLKSVVAECYGVIKACAGLHIIHQPVGATPQSFFLPITDL